jgi:hypothetical protein
MLTSLAAMGQVLAGFGLNAQGITVCYPGKLWDLLRDELKVEEALRKIDAPLQLGMTVPGLLSPMQITMKKAEEPSSLLIT